jgi:hypothetical protein
MSSSWIEILLDEYPTKRSDDAIGRFAKFFGDQYEPEVLAMAVNDYMLAGEKFFPKIPDFVSYVRNAADRAVVASTRRTDWFDDNDLLAFEQRRGSMPADADLAEAEAEARRALAAWGRCGACGGQQDNNGRCPLCATVSNQKEKVYA